MQNNWQGCNRPRLNFWTQHIEAYGYNPTDAKIFQDNQLVRIWHSNRIRMPHHWMLIHGARCTGYRQRSDILQFNYGFTRAHLIGLTQPTKSDHFLGQPEERCVIGILRTPIRDDIWSPSARCWLVAGFGNLWKWRLAFSSQCIHRTSPPSTRFWRQLEIKGSRSSWLLLNHVLSATSGRHDPITKLVRPFSLLRERLMYMV